ncbi:acyl-CoA synthetase [Dietzia sp.]|uniref:acyl-CoA synthetase n=1 Tax=Dietzia sp. TaxID=1871616 RepID=UPI002FDB1C59
MTAEQDEQATANDRPEQTPTPRVPPAAGVPNPATGTNVTSAFEIARVSPERPALIAPDGTEVSYGEFASRTHRLAHGLRALGLGAGDSIVLLAPNGREFLEVYFAALEIGLYIAPANWHLAGPEVAYILDNSEAGAFVAAERFAEVAVTARESAALDPARCFAIGEVPGFRPIDELAAGHPDTPPDGRTLGGPMLYTSGTTGRPKGVRRPLTGASPDEITVPNYFFFAGFGIEAPDNVHICGSPLYHTAVLNFVVISLQLGQLVVLMDRWSPEAMLRLIERHGVTHSHMVPTQFSRLLELPEDVRERYDVSSLRTVIHGAAPCPLHVKRAMLEWWGPKLTEYYAGTEGGGCTITGEEWLHKPGSVGRPWATSEIRILDDDGGPLPTGEIGNVYVEMRGSSFSYYKDPDKTEGARVGKMFTMGDLGYLDADGYLFLCDRKNDMIISGGVNIYPAEVESELLALPEVRDAAVFGIPHPDWGEEVKAVVEPSAGSVPPNEAAAAALAESILSGLSGRLARFKMPRSVDFVEALPRQENGKLVKRVLKDPYWT